MANFNDFVQIELPKRPFVEVDGQAGQILVRSNNPGKPRELVWTDAQFGDATVVSYEAAHDISGHRVLTLNDGGKAIYADSTDLTHAVKIIGISTAAGLTGSMVPTVREGKLEEPSWNWTAGLPIFLGSTGYLTQTVPTKINSNFLLYIGFATSTTSILISIEAPINLF